LKANVGVIDKEFTEISKEVYLGCGKTNGWGFDISTG